MIYAWLFLSLLLLALLATADWISDLLINARRQPVTRTPGDYGLSYEDVAIQSSDGLTLNGLWIPAGRASGMEWQAPAVILLHPLFGNRHGFRPLPEAWARLLRTEVDLLKPARDFHEAGYAVLLFDFRSHGASQGGRCAGGLTEDQDVVGAVDYVFGRLAVPFPDGEPQVGLVGFGLGAAAAIAAAGREKGGAEIVRVFSGDSEGGVGYIEIQPANVKKLRCLVAVEPASLGKLLRGYLHRLCAPLDRILVPLVDRICQWRGGYPLVGAFLRKLAREVNIPTLYVQSRLESQNVQANERDAEEVQRLYNATSGPKELWLVDAPHGWLEASAYSCDHTKAVRNQKADVPQDSMDPLYPFGFGLRY